MPAVPKEAKDRHAKLTTDLSNYIAGEIDPVQLKQLNNRLKAQLSPLERSKAKDIMDILESMEKKGIVAPGQYDLLKTILKEFDTRIVEELIEPAEEEISELIKNANTPECSTGYNLGEKPPSKKRKAEGATSMETPPGSKNIKTEIAIPDSAKDVYYITKGQKGFMLILNFSKDRAGSEGDVEKLRDFFEDKFKFDVECELDLPKEELKKTLVDIRNEYLTGRHAKKYYCFLCIVMSHGDEKGIRTHDDQSITMDEITDYFKNEHTKDFLGKPKVFVVQACRGSAVQGVVESDDWPQDIDKYVGKLSVPHDADILIAYATTPGNKAFRTKYSEVGAWFIHVLLEVIKETYEDDHLEEMLISVRSKIALDTEWRRGGYCQMPCSWTTLTKRLFFR